MNANDKRHGKYLTILGAFLMTIPLDYGTTWGNISVYVSSYIWKRFGIASGLQAPWMVSVYIIAFSVAPYLDGVVQRFATKRTAAAIGLLAFNGGMLAHWWLIQQRDALELLLVAVTLSGLGSGTLVCVCSRFVADWLEPEHLGSGVFIFYSGASLGNVLLNPLVSLYVNPTNLDPTAELNHLKLFTDRAVVDKTPSMFLLLGGMSLFCQFIGFLMLRQNTSAKIQTESSALVSISASGSSLTSDISSRSNTGIHYVFKSPALYALWVAFLSMEYTYIHLANYYKVYGEQRISDDHFLSDQTIPVGIATGVFRLSWGFVIDKLGIKTSLSIVLAAEVVCPFLSYFMAMVNKWLYMVFNTAFFCVRASVMPTFLVAASVYFDKSHFSTCYGLITSGGIVGNLTGPLLFSYLIATYGWFSSYAAVAIFSFVGLVTTLMYLPGETII